MGAQADQVRDSILDKVLERKLLPGDRIDESELRERLGVSGTPIREALIALETAGVVERRPRDGARVTSLDLEGVIKITEVLAEAEGSAAYLAARRINSTQAANLKAAAQDCTDFAEGRSAKDANYYGLNLLFHQCLFQASGNEYMQESIFALGSRVVAYLAARHSLPGEVQRSAQDHARITQAILSGEADLARTLMVNHVTFNDRLAIDVMNTMNVDKT